MFMHNYRVLILYGCCFAATLSIAGESPQLGKALTPAQMTAHNFTVLPTGEGLPAGEGTAQAGKPLYQMHCLSCHGLKGIDGLGDRLAGGHGTLATSQPIKTIGSYWPYATTVFSYIRRAMPYNAPGSLSDDEVYAVTAYLLHINGIIEAGEKIDAQSLPHIKMPNHDGFVWSTEE